MISRAYGYLKKYVKINLSFFRILEKLNFFIFFSLEANMGKTEKIQFLQNTEKGKIDFHICFKVPIGLTDHAKKHQKNWGHTDFLARP